MIEDRRKRKTTAIIEKIFIELLGKKSMDKISVTEICEKADINRGTFYLHYTDINNLSESIQDKILNNAKNILNCNVENQNNNSNFIVPLLDNLKENKSFLLALSINSNIDNFVKKISKIIREMIIKLNDNFNLKVDEKSLSYITSYFVGATFGIISNWIKNECKDETQQVADLIFNLTFNGMNCYK